MSLGSRFSTGGGSGSGAVTRARVLQSAATLFATCGYHEANIRRIGEDASVDAALVIRHFENKCSLFLEVLDEELRRFALASEEQGAGACDRLASLILASAYAPRDVRSAAAVRISHAFEGLIAPPAMRALAGRLGELACTRIGLHP